MSFAAQLALSVLLSGSGLQTLGDLTGRWSCASGAQRFDFTIAERHARPDRPDSPVESLTVMLSGAPLVRTGLSKGLIVYDARDGRLHFDGEGRCTQPAPIEDDDDPESGLQRCVKVSASAPASRAPDARAPMRWTVTVGGAGLPNRVWSLELRTPRTGALGLRLKAGSRAVFAASCTRSKR